MTFNGWLQILIYAIVILIITKPLREYMFRVFEGEQQPWSRFFGPIERWLYRRCGRNP
jgi:K+-transporting ATPase ATPase A chain